MTVEEAGRMNREKAAKTKGPEFYSEMGRKGGDALTGERITIDTDLIGYESAGGDRVGTSDEGRGPYGKKGKQLSKKP